MYVADICPLEVKSVLTLRGTALHDVEQLCDIALHSCGIGLIDYFPSTTDLDGMSFFLCLSSSHFCCSAGRASKAEVAA